MLGVWTAPMRSAQERGALDRLRLCFDSSYLSLGIGFVSFMLYYYIFYNICYMPAHPPDPKSAAVCIASFFAALLAAKYQTTLAQSILAYKDRFHNQFVYTCLYAASVFILAILLDTAWAWAYRPSFNVFILFSACFVLLALSILVNAILREDGTMASQKMAQSNNYILGEKRSRESNSGKGSGGGDVDIKIQ